MTSGWRNLALVCVWLTSCAAVVSCASDCGVIHRTTSPPETVVIGSDAVVRARFDGFTERSRGRVEGILDINEVLAQVPSATADTLRPGRLTVATFDDRCTGRSPLREGRTRELLVVLHWVGFDDATSGSPWLAYRVLVERPDGRVEFIDNFGEGLNARIDEILVEPTVRGLVDTVLGTRLPTG